MTEKHLVRNLFIITNKMRRYLDKEHQRNNIYLGQARILKYIYQSGISPIYQKDIEKTFSIRGASVSALLESLVKAGLLKRIESLFDKRKKSLILTDLGLEKAQEVVNTTKAFEKAIELSLNEEEVISLEQITRKLNQFIDNKEKESYERSI